MINVLTEKQINAYERILYDDFFILGLHGAKRSGKTYINNLIFLRELKRVRKIADRLGVEEPMYILAGTSSTSIQNNVLQELYNSFDIEPKYNRHGSFTLLGVKIIQVYTGSIAGLKRARGFTAYGAYINEASLANELVFKEIISRCSGEGARVIWDSNPDNPNHWLKTDYIDNPADDMIINFHFRLDDNTFLSERYKQSIKVATPSGKFYDRDIEGLWTVAEGAIYSEFDKSIHMVDKAPDKIVRYYAGVDWGYEHHGSIVIIGETADGTGYILDGIAEQHKHIEWWVARAKEFNAKYGDIPYYCDTARVEHIDYFTNSGINALYANKSVMAGIEEVAKRYKARSLFYVKGTIPLFEKEIFEYRWKTNSTHDEPVKENDDVMDAVRYAVYTQKLVDEIEARKMTRSKYNEIKSIFG